jgi:hypothetical protein
MAQLYLAEIEEDTFHGGLLVTFEYVDGDDVRGVEVFVGVSRRRSRAWFPHNVHETGESLGDDLLDDHVRRRAVEEAVRYLAAKAA